MVVEKDNIIKELHRLNPTTVTQETDIPVKILKDNKDFVAGYFQLFFNYAITLSKFPSSLEMANIKGTKCLNYRPISISPLASKIFERVFRKNLKVSKSIDWFLYEGNTGI